MNDFERMMLREGVNPIQAKKVARNIEGSNVRGEELPHYDNKPEDTRPQYYWAQGQEARTTVNTALDRIKRDRENGHETWISAFSHVGKTCLFKNNATMGEILTRADTENLKVIVLAGHGWSCIMHPSMGIATIEEDPN